MKPKTMLLMAIVFGCGLLAGQSRTLRSPTRDQAPPENKVQVLAARQKLAPWTPIKDPSKLFEVKEVPVYAAPKRAVTSLENAKNQILCKTLNEGAFLSEDDLLDRNQAADLCPQMVWGERATAIRVSPVTLSQVLPGSRVDVIAITRDKDPRATVILQNMLVLQVEVIEGTATLSAGPEECQLLALAQETCELRVNLRPVADYAPVHRILPPFMSYATGAQDNTSPEPK